LDDRVMGARDKHGLRIPYKTKFSKKAVAWMQELCLGFMDDAILRSDLALLETLDEQIGARAPASLPDPRENP
jgi:hypothetical protein